MSVKNLARAIIQGGRSNSSKFNRRQATRVERRQAKRYAADMVASATPDRHVPRLDFELGAIVIDTVHAADGFVAPVRRRVDVDFADRLGPLRAWLGAQEGRAFEEAWHRLCAHDRRTTAGRHLIDHADDSLAARAALAFRSRDFVADADGVLRPGEDFDWPPYGWNDGRPSGDEAKAWAAGRAVVNRNGELLWKDGGEFIPMGEGDVAFYESLRGHDQRSLRGYRRPHGGGRRKARELPWQRRRKANLAAIGRSED